jgi:uncharacterized DUF497 family protein
VRHEYRWIEWNLAHIAEHGVIPEEAEHVVDGARRPYPELIGDRYLVVGQTDNGEYLQVVYVFDPPGVVFVLHARPLNAREKRRLRRRRR